MILYYWLVGWMMMALQYKAVPLHSTLDTHEPLVLNTPTLLHSVQAAQQNPHVNTIWKWKQKAWKAAYNGVLEPLSKGVSRASRKVGQETGEVMGHVALHGYHTLETMARTVGQETFADKVERFKYKKVANIQNATTAFVSHAFPSTLAMVIGVATANPWIIGSSAVGFVNSGYQMHLEHKLKRHEMSLKEYKRASRWASGISVGAAVVGGIGALGVQSGSNAVHATHAMTERSMNMMGQVAQVAQTTGKSAALSTEQVVSLVGAKEDIEHFIKPRPHMIYT